MNVTDEYLETRVMTAAPEELHMMVVDGAVRNAAQAVEALQRNDFETSHFSLNRAREFVIELISGLDESRCEELVDIFKGLFGFVYRNLTDADLYHDAAKAEDALRILRMHRETWQQLLRERKTTAQNDVSSSPEQSRGQSWIG